MAIPALKQLLEAGVHFGHQTRRWDPRMKSYIFTERNGIHIIDLQQTMKAIKMVYNFVKGEVEKGKSILFVGTKKQAQNTIAQEAARCGMHYVNQRWMGGTLTNFQTIRKSIQRLQQYEEYKEKGLLRMFPRKEQIAIEKMTVKLLKSLGGIKNLKGLPGAVFIVDPKRETIAVKEANTLKIPVIALADTNCNPDPINYIIPGNDDAIRAINLITGVIADAVQAGQAMAKDTSAPELLSADEAFAPTEEEMAIDVEKYEKDFDEDDIEEVEKKRRMKAKEAAEESEQAPPTEV